MQVNYSRIGAMTQKEVLVVAVYSHIEAYPPSLNAITHLAERFDEIYVLHRNVLPSSWVYPTNVSLIDFGDYIPADQVYRLSLRSKVRSYFDFGVALRKLVDKQRPELLLVYDGIAFTLANLFIGAKALSQLTFWYHNHDVMYERELSMSSLMWWIRKLELYFFHRIDYFTLPTYARLKFFPISKLLRTPVIIPNFPSIGFYGKWRSKSSAEALRLIFQGQIGSSNEIEKLIKLLSCFIGSKRIELHLVGPISRLYRQELQTIAEECKVSDRVFFYGRLPYSELPPITSSCHVGVAMYSNHNAMVRTMSTASNKIFEYASVGLPVIVNDREDMRKEFESYNWIHFAQFETKDLLSVLNVIVQNYEQFSASARSDFESSLNFENAFIPFLSSIKYK